MQSRIQCIINQPFIMRLPPSRPATHLIGDDHWKRQIPSTQIYGTLSPVFHMHCLLYWLCWLNFGKHCLWLFICTVWCVGWFTYGKGTIQACELFPCCILLVMSSFNFRPPFRPICPSPRWTDTGKKRCLCYWATWWLYCNEVQDVF